MHHVRHVSPSVSGRVPCDRAVADGEVDVASCKYPPAAVDIRGGSRAACRQIGDCSVVPIISVWIVAISLVREGVAAARVDIAA